MSEDASVQILFGRRLRALRNLRELTQDELGERAGVSGKFVGQIERGSGNPSLLILARLGAALQIELSELLRFEELSPEGKPAGAARAYAARELVGIYLSGRPAADIERALRILEAALGEADAGTRRSRR